MDESDEEIIVYVNFEEGTVEKDVLQVPTVPWKVIGLDSSTPIAQLGETTFKGEWKDTSGTKVLFEEDPVPVQYDAAFSVPPPTMLKLNCQSSKLLEFSRIFPKNKNVNGNQNAGNLQAQHEAVNSIAECDLNSTSISEDFNDIINLTNSTIMPTFQTANVMKDIVNETSHSEDQEEMSS